MPILSQEPDLYPADLLDQPAELGNWWALYTMSRREKELMRRLRLLGVPHYSPIIAKRSRSPAGRIRTSFVPLFANYVFICGDETHRYRAVATGCVSKNVAVSDGKELFADLKRIRDLIALGAPLTPESRLEKGDYIRVRNGPFRGFEGTVLRREGQTRLLIAVKFLQQGASVILEDCHVELC